MCALAVAARVHSALSAVVLQHAAYRETLLQQHGFTVLDVRHIHHVARMPGTSDCETDHVTIRSFCAAGQDVAGQPDGVRAVGGIARP